MKRLRNIPQEKLNKKLKRREKAMLIKENKVNEIETELEQLKLEKSDVEEKNESLQSEVNTLKNDRKSLLVKICRLKKSRNFEMEANNDKIQTLRHEILEKENQIAELEEINEVLNDNEITSFYNGQYTSEVRQTIMTLVNELGVSQKKVNGVMKTVVQSLTGKTLSRLPSTSVLSRLRIEAKRVAQIQVTEAMVNAGGDASTVKGNCLHQDATSKFHRHFQSFQITTSDNVTYSLGLSEIAGGDSQTLFETFQENLSELSNALKHDQNDIAQLVSTIVATMSDQGAINPIFNKQLQELRESLMPDIVENWDTYSHDTKPELCKLSNYFCKMHVFVNMANKVDKCMNVFEKSVCMGSNPFSLGLSESGGARLVRTVSKALTMHGCEKFGIGQLFQAYFKIEDKETNRSPSEDIGPFWREIERKRNILDLNPLLEVLQLKLEEYPKNSSALLEGETPFPDEMLAKDEVYHSLFEFENATIETYTQITTNSCSERDFAQLDVLMRLKPAASIECLESIIIWTNNETSAWLADKTKAEREDITEQARKDTEQMQLKIKQKRNKLMSEKHKKLQEKQDRKTKKQEKEYVQTIKLTDKLTRYGGLWTTMNEVDFHLSQAKNENNATEALVGQLQFRKQILKSCG
ncbi:hypothetical protein MAR_003477 [Mya arenaria]|uniref:Uncharacterized protein n=1 Tax=Mya arenaria TaxID=6604 RepID=A0ABY7G8N4_MYAAR|nr:hypothetical protein MAR_003477 [Mya arenaria]